MNIPIVSLDKIYIKPDEENIYFLDCTRVNGCNELISRQKLSLDIQIKILSKLLPSNKIILADDVVFSGTALKNIINKFNFLGIKVVGIISSVCTIEAYNYFNKNLKYGIKTNYLLEKDVIDQICERDFYFGIAGSGIFINTKNGLYKAPYFKPYGNPYERASIPIKYVDKFSISCLDRSIYLWEEINKFKNKETLIKELPEKIINTNPNEEIVKVLKKEMKRV